MSEKRPDLQTAYAIQTPDDNRRVYADWAQTYDQDFVAAMAYRLPLEVATAFVAAGGVGPVLDVGAGTGAVGQLLADLGIDQIDGTDISPEMLGVAAQKGVYRRLFPGDVTGQIDVPDQYYAGIVSAGTFTLGHVGPPGLDEVLRIAAPQAFVVLSINRAHWDKAGFDQKFDTIKAQITDFILRDVAIYGSMSTGEHAGDRAQIVSFRRR